MEVGEDMGWIMNRPEPLRAGDEIECENTLECKRNFKAMQRLGIKGRISDSKPLTIVVLEDEVITWR